MTQHAIEEHDELSMSQTRQIRVQDSIIPAVINGMVNGAIAKWKFGDQNAIPLTLDLISTRQHTVWGEGVTLAFALGIISTLITGNLFARRLAKANAPLAKRAHRPGLVFLLTIALGNAMTLFGWFVALAVVWQRLVGTVEVTALCASMLIGLLAGFITLVVERRTKHALLLRS